MTKADSAIRQMFGVNLGCYTRLDAKGLAALHATPSFIVHGGKVFIMNDETKAPYHQSILAENVAEGEHFWKMADFELDQVAPNGSVVKIHWIAKRPDGSVLWDGYPAYMVADDGNGWPVWANISSNPY